jgi:HD superfamily phosphohydrolase
VGFGLMHIRDAVIGDIRVTDNEVSILNDPAVQRLNQIKQLGFAYFVYPGANHTRMEHSLGTMSITREILLNAEDEKIEELECAALLHDIGHAAYSHFSDALLKKYLHTDHETIGIEKVSEGTIKERIEDAGLSLSKIKNYMKGEGKGEIITGSLGSDRFDYLARDAHYTGVGYGIVDYGHLRNKIRIIKGKPVIEEAAVGNAEYMLIARYLMFNSIYHHHTILIAQGMYENAVESAISSGEMLPSDLKTLNDWKMLAMLHNIKESKAMGERLSNRLLFKRAFFGRIQNHINVKDLREEIEKAGFGREEYVCSAFKYKGDNDEVYIIPKEDASPVKLTEHSPLVGTLINMIKDTERLLVACDPSNMEKMKKILNREIGLPKKDQQIHI